MKWNEQIAEDMALARGNGATWDEIAYQYGLSRSTVRRWVIRWVRGTRARARGCGE